MPTGGGVTAALSKKALSRRRLSVGSVESELKSWPTASTFWRLTRSGLAAGRPLGTSATSMKLAVRPAGRAVRAGKSRLR